MIMLNGSDRFIGTRQPEDACSIGGKTFGAENLRAVKRGEARLKMQHRDSAQAGGSERPNTSSLSLSCLRGGGCEHSQTPYHVHEYELIYIPSSFVLFCFVLFFFKKQTRVSLYFLFEAACIIAHPARMS